MNIRLIRRVYAAVALCGVAFPAGAAAAGDTAPPDVIASFEGRKINLAEDWEDAQACVLAPDGARCYRTEAEMDDAEGPMPQPGGVVALAECSSKLRLYDGTSYGGTVLELQTRSVYHNLASSGFDNRTSSYKIGACSARFYDTTTGGTQYPGNTNANVWASSMSSGWNNRVGSVYIL